MILRPALFALVLLLLTARTAADEARIAVASNFMAPASLLAQRLASQGEHRVVLVSGVTGRLYAQVVHGAPFDALLAADAERPTRLEREGHAVRGSRFTYAIGRLVLWSSDPARVAADGAVLAGGDFRHLAIANPETAPYGRAALETLTSLGLRERLEPRLVRGESIAQAFQFVASGNAELGLVALAQLRGPQGAHGGSYWLVPEQHHAPIVQQAVLLRDSAAARAFLDLLRSPESAGLLHEFGYDSPDDR